MRGIILAGGEGTRLRPLTLGMNKHMVRIGKYPMIEYPLNKLIVAGMKNIHVVTGGENYQGLIKYLGSGSRYGIRITYSIQDESGGIAEALGLAEPFVDDDKMVVLLGDNIFDMPINKVVADFGSSTQEREAVLFRYPSDNPQRFGVLKFENEIAVDVIEKPINPPSRMILTGIYFYTPDVFDIIRDLKKSDRGEYEITDVNRYYIRNRLATIETLYGKWTDCGTYETLLSAEKLMGETL